MMTIMVQAKMMIGTKHGMVFKIAKDISSIPNAIDYYETELEDAKKECKIYGNIEKASVPNVLD